VIEVLPLTLLTDPSPFFVLGFSLRGVNSLTKGSLDQNATLDHVISGCRTIYLRGLQVSSLGIVDWDKRRGNRIIWLIHGVPTIALARVNHQVRLALQYQKDQCMRTYYTLQNKTSVLRHWSTGLVSTGESETTGGTAFVRRGLLLGRSCSFSSPDSPTSISQPSR
jgi:hypothetical protein